MKTVFNVLKWAVGIIAMVLVAGVSYLHFFLPNVPDAESIDIELTEERLIRGAYLANHVAACMDCHAVRDWTLYSAPPIAGTVGAGGERYGSDMGLPAELISANITPDSTTGIGLWTKEMFLARFKAFDPDSAAYIPVAEGGFNTPMPWTMYAGMSDDDLGAIYDYLRTVRPITHSFERFSPPVAASPK